MRRGFCRAGGLLSIQSTLTLTSKSLRTLSPAYMIPKLLPEPVWVSTGVKYPKGEHCEDQRAWSWVWILNVQAEVSSWVCGGLVTLQNRTEVGKEKGCRVTGWGPFAPQIIWIAGISKSLVGNHLKLAIHLDCEAHCFEKLGFNWPLRSLHGFLVCLWSNRGLLYCGY